MINRYASLRQGLVGCWCPSVSGSFGFRLPDLSGYGNAGTLVSMDPGTDWVPSGGKLALDFDGVDDSVTVPGLSRFNGASIATLSGWLGRNSTANTPCFGFANGSSVGGNRYSVIWFSDGNLYVNAEDISSSSYGFTSRSGVGIIHIAAVFIGAGSNNSTRLIVYINGTQQTLTFGGTIPSSLGNVTPFVLGKDSSNRFGAGYIDDVRIYNRALTPNEIRLLYTGGRGVGFIPERIKHRRKTTAAASNRRRRIICGANC